MKKLRILNYLIIFSELLFLCFSQNILISDTFAASGVITTFSDGSSSKTVLIPPVPPGSPDSTIAVQIPQDVIIIEARVDVTGGTGLNSLDLWNFENSCRCDDATCVNPCWDMVPDPAGVLGQVLHMNRASIPTNRRAITKWNFPDGITIEFLARGDAVADIADTTIGFYSNADASSYWFFDLGCCDKIGIGYYDGGVGSHLINGCAVNTLSTANNKWFNVNVSINNGNFYAKTWIHGTPKPATNQIERYWDVGTNQWVLRYWDYGVSVWQTVADPGGNDPNKKMIFGNHIMIGTECGQHNEEFWFQAITAYDIKDFTIDVGPDGVIDYSNPSFVGTVLANFNSKTITKLISSNICANPVGNDCLLNLELSTSSGGEITLDNLVIRWMTIEGGLVPCGRLFDNSATSWDERDPCNFCFLLLMISNIMNFLIMLASGIAVLFVIITGLLFITSSGDAGRKSQAKTALKYVLIGFIVIFIAWIIIDFLLIAFGYLDPLGGEWNVICE